MEHLVNEPIEAEMMQEVNHHISPDNPKLCFIYHKGLNVGYDVELYIHYHRVIGEVVYCWQLDSGDWKIEVEFYDEKEAFKVRMLEQAVRIEKYHREHSYLTIEEASLEWVKKFGSDFSRR